MATVKDALDLTTRTIDRRAFHYRNLVVLLTPEQIAEFARRAKEKEKAAKECQQA